MSQKMCKQIIHKLAPLFLAPAKLDGPSVRLKKMISLCSICLCFVFYLQITYPLSSLTYNKVTQTYTYTLPGLGVITVDRNGMNYPTICIIEQFD